MDSIGDLVDNLIYSFKSKSLKVSASSEAEPISKILLHYYKGSRDMRAIFFFATFFEITGTHFCMHFISLISARIYLIVYEMVNFCTRTVLCIDHSHDHRPKSQYTVNVYLSRDFTQYEIYYLQLIRYV